MHQTFSYLEYVDNCDVTMKVDEITSEGVDI